MYRARDSRLGRIRAAIRGAAAEQGNGPVMSELWYGFIKIGALACYCGGPLLLSDVLKVRYGTPFSFGVTFLPILLMFFGTDPLMDRSSRRHARDFLNQGEPVSHEGVDWGVLVMRLGLAGALVVLGMNAYGAWLLTTMPRRPDHYLYVVGMVVGTPLAGLYAYVAMRWLRRVAAPQDIFSPFDPR